MAKTREAEVTEYWLEHYVRLGLCSLCGNTGVVDTRNAVSPVGLRAGRLNWCICPNGQGMRAAAGKPTPEGGEESSSQ
jgi:hypothetical protein